MTGVGLTRAVAPLVIALVSCRYPPLPDPDVDAGPIDAPLDAPPDAPDDADVAADGPGTSICGDGQPLSVDVLAAEVAHLALGVGSSGDAFAAWTAETQGWTAQFAPATGLWTSVPLETPHLSWGLLGIGVGRRGDVLVGSGSNGLWTYQLDPGATSGIRTFHVLLRDTGRPPRVTVGDDGSELLVWSAVIGGGHQGAVVRTRHFDVDVGWGDLVQLSAEGATEHPPQLAATGRGDAIVSWREHASADLRLVVRRYRVDQAEWTDPSTLTQATHISEAAVAFDRRGNQIVAWNELRDGRQDLRAAVATAGSDAWGPAHTLASDVGHADPPAMLTGPAGDVTVLWRAGQSANLWGASRRESGWSEPAVVISREDGVGTPRVASDEHGNAIVAWPECDDVTCRIEVVKSAASEGVWRRVVATHVSSAPEAALALAVGVSEASAFVAWQTERPPAICVARIW
jgi:hypothetical protein